MKTFIYISLICIFAFSAQTLNAQGRNSITGFVFGESRTPVSNVYVELLSDTYAPLGRVLTNSSGLYAFRGIGNGQYMIKILTTGTDYEEQTTSISLVPVSAIAGSGAISEQLDFYLRPKKRRGAAAVAPPGVVFVQEIPENAKKMYESGVIELADKKEESGLIKIKQSIEIFPKYFLALDRLGNEYLTRGYYLPASVLFVKAIEVNPKSFSSTFGLGLASYRLNQNDESIKQFKNALLINNSSINGHLWLGIALHNKKNLSEALTSILQADKLSNGTAAEVHFQLARIYKDMKDYQKAAGELELFLKYKPDATNAAEIKQAIKTLREKK